MASFAAVFDVKDSGAVWRLRKRARGAREVAHKALDEMLDALDLMADGESAPTLAFLSEQLMMTRQDVLGACILAAIQRRYAAELQQELAPCPTCTRVIRRKRLDDKEISTLHGRVTLSRPYFYCAPCGRGFHPLDVKLQLSPRTHQFDVQEQSTALSAELPFGLSHRRFHALTGVNASPHFMHETLNAVGAAATVELVVPGAEEIAQRIELAQQGTHRRPVLVVSCDGAHAPTRPPGKRKEKRGPGTWQEAKGYRLYLLGKGQRIVHVASWHQIGDKAELSSALGVIAARIPRDRVRIALVGDGSDWVWNVMLEHFAGGEEVLDYYHCSEYLHKVARAQFDEGSLEGLEWVESAMTLLGLNEVDEAIALVEATVPKDAAASNALAKLAEYITAHRERHGYDELRRRGLPLGSGGMESANKFICHVRLKRSGAWWLVANGNAMLRIRCAIYNDTFSSVFAEYTKRTGPSTSSQ